MIPRQIQEALLAVYRGDTVPPNLVAVLIQRGLVKKDGYQLVLTPRGEEKALQMVWGNMC